MAQSRLHLIRERFDAQVAERAKRVVDNVGDAQQQLARDAASGDGLARALLHDLYGPALLEGVRNYLAHRGVHDFSTAEDVVEDFFLYLYERGLHRFSASKGQLYPWLRTGAIRRAKNRMSLASSSSTELPQVLFDDLAYSPHDLVEVEELREQVRVGLRLLPISQQDILHRRWFAGQRLVDIARHLQLHPDAVRRRLHNAELALRRVLSTHYKRELRT